MEDREAAMNRNKTETYMKPPDGKEFLNMSDRSFRVK
jgi:hypothetical protein